MTDAINKGLIERLEAASGPEALATHLEAQAAAIAELEAIVSGYWNAIDILQDGPDESDEAMAQRLLAEAHGKAGALTKARATA